MADIANVQKDRIVIESASGNDMAIDSEGRVEATSRSIVSSSNSTTTPLGSNATFTGTAIETLQVAVITVFVYTSHSSATNGLKAQWSTDGTNWDDEDTFTITTTGTKQFSFGPMAARYFRIAYTNGATAQSAFRLQTILHPFYIKPSSHRIGDTISAENDAELMISVLQGQSSITGNFEPVKTKSNRLLVSQELSSPANTTAVVQSAFGDVATTTGEDTIYTITNGKTLTIQRLSAGSEETTGGSVVELFEDPNGNLTGMTRIETIFTNGNSGNVDIGLDFIGNGTRRIVLRRRGFTSSAREMFGRWQGFEV